MNVRRLRRIRDLILKYPKRVEMETWFGVMPNFASDSFEIAVPKLAGASCGTTGCVAGWAVSLYDGKRIRRGRVAGTTRRLLGLTPPQGDRLFLPEYWPQDLRIEYYEKRDLGSARMVSRMIAKRIDHFIATKGAE